jgi:hypothetical protein
MHLLRAVSIGLGLLAATACGVEQSASCAHFVRCVQARDAQQGAQTNVDRFLVDGKCWGAEELAAQCDRGCQRGLDWLRTAYADLPPECR